MGVVPALESLREAGLLLAVVSNSEGTLGALLEDLGLAPFFHAVIDSWHFGSTKPEAAIFREALGKLSVSPEEAIMVGDSMSADVEGALGAGIPAVLLDPFDLHPNAPVPRFAAFSDFADAILSSPRDRRRVSTP